MFTPPPYVYFRKNLKVASNQSQPFSILLLKCLVCSLLALLIQIPIIDFKLHSQLNGHTITTKFHFFLSEKGSSNVLTCCREGIITNKEKVPQFTPTTIPYRLVMQTANNRGYEISYLYFVNCPSNGNPVTTQIQFQFGKSQQKNIFQFSKSNWLKMKIGRKEQCKVCRRADIQSSFE